STVYTPAPGIPNLKEIPEFPSGLKLSLVNAQPNTEKIVLVSGGGSTYYANLHDWTERLNKSLKETLQKRHVEVVDGAHKFLKLSIEKAVVNMQAGGFNPRCTLNWKIDLG